MTGFNRRRLLSALASVGFRGSFERTGGLLSFPNRNGSNWRRQMEDLKISSGRLAGAYRMRPAGGVNWYFSHKALSFLVDEDPEGVLAYLNLYTAEARPEVGYAQDWAEDLTTPRFPDSHDAYAGTLLSLAARYVTTSGDLLWLHERWGRLAAIAEANILSQFKSNGLVRTYQRPHANNIGYLMDQCECYAGLRDLGRALEIAGERSSSIYTDAAAGLGEAINTVFYDARSRAWRWCDDGTAIRQRWYPDLVCQVFPHLYGVVSSKRERDLTRYADGYAFLCSGAREWWCRPYDDFPWLVIAYYVASRLGDTERAHQMVATAGTLPPDRFTVMDLAYAHALTYFL